MAIEERWRACSFTKRTGAPNRPVRVHSAAFTPYNFGLITSDSCASGRDYPVIYVLAVHHLLPFTITKLVLEGVVMEATIPGSGCLSLNTGHKPSVLIPVQESVIRPSSVASWETQIVTTLVDLPN